MTCMLLATYIGYTVGFAYRADSAVELQVRFSQVRMTTMTTMSAEIYLVLIQPVSCFSDRTVTLSLDVSVQPLLEENI